jgi:ubiquinone/menaquinone biosynthesis C-methylase UbiE
MVDLGSGAGREVLQAAVQVGSEGKSIGIDMTPEMVSRARMNAAQANLANAEFRLGEIEQLPLPDSSVDVVISNCVINLVPDKVRAFQEAYRILRSGGRLVVADMVSNGPLPEKVRQDVAAWAGCIAGAMDLKDYLAAIKAAGFRRAEVLEAGLAPPGQVFSATVRATKP